MVDRHRWTTEQLKLLAMYYPDPGLTNEELVLKIGKTIKAIWHKAGRLGVSRGRNQAAVRDPVRRRQYDNDYYMKNKIQLYTNRKKRRAEFTSWLKTQFGARCRLCGYNKCLQALEFHHPNNDKENEVSRLIKNEQYEQALNEAKKCDLVCSNCHREITYAPTHEINLAPVKLSLH